MSVTTNMRKIMILANDTTYTYNLRDVLIKRFINAEYKVVVACECLNYEKEMLALGVRLINIKMNRHSKNPFSDILLLTQFIKVLRKEKPSVVLTYNIKPNVYGGMACKMLGIPYIPNITGLGTAVENAGIMQKISTILYKIGVSKAVCVMFQNESNQKYFVDNNLLGKNSLMCLLPGSGVNIEKFTCQPYPAQDSTITFSIIGRIMKDKGTDELIEAIKIVKSKYPEVLFKLIGYFDDNYQHIVEKAVDDGLLEYVKEQKDVRPLIIESWAVIQPSHHEGMSNTLLESAASGRPVIATDIPGCRETFDSGKSGFAFPAGNSKVLAETIQRFIVMPYSEKQRMGLAGRAKMEQEFDRNIVAQAYLSEISKTEKENNETL